MPRRTRLPPDTRLRWNELGQTVDWQGRRISQFALTLEARKIMLHFDTYRAKHYADEDWRHDPLYNARKPHR